MQAYCLLQTTLYTSIALGVGMVPRWIGTVAGRVDPQGFAEMTPLQTESHWLKWVLSVIVQIVCGRTPGIRGSLVSRKTSLGAPSWFGWPASIQDLAAAASADSIDVWLSRDDINDDIDDGGDHQLTAVKRPACTFARNPLTLYLRRVARLGAISQNGLLLKPASNKK